MKINRNVLWTSHFVNELVALGMHSVVISPGSRSTPLTTAFAKNQQIQKHIIIDERSAAFFALGLAKSTDTPVALVCTSGTAVAEYYPAIIEAYQTRVPLIVCTADRPPELRHCGANQTINQDNIYRNHIRWFIDVGIPEISAEKLQFIKNIAKKAFTTSLIHRKGPVHINFPFRKPLESHLSTDNADISMFSSETTKGASKIFLYNEIEFDQDDKRILDIKKHIENGEKGLILIGPMAKNADFLENCAKLATYFKFPVFADIQSHIRFSGDFNAVLIENYDVLLRNKGFISENSPDFILQFGRTPTSKGVEDWLTDNKTPRFLINEYGDCFDPQKIATIIKYDPTEFCKHLLNSSDEVAEDKWLFSYKLANSITEEEKRLFTEEKFSVEPTLMLNIMEHVPENSALMVSNSTPIRDFDFFASRRFSDIEFFSNRGASGIDGIISTAVGIASGIGRDTYLVIGDLAFLHDISALLHLKNLNISLTIILVNNNGGGIFEFLPISKEKDIFKEYFLTPQNHDFGKILDGFDIPYLLIEEADDLKRELNKVGGGIRVLEIQTDAKRSLKVRNAYRKAVDNQL